MLTFILSLFFSLQSFSIQAPKNEINESIWTTLMSVKYNNAGIYYIPKFSKKIVALENKIITVSGYMYPIDEKQATRIFMLSYYPIKVCYFCGGAGPESVIEVFSKKPIRLRQKKIKLKGKLKLNRYDKERLFYILLNAEVVD